MAKKMKLILLRLAWFGRESLEADLMGIHGEVGGAKIGGHVYMCSGTVVGMCGDEWEQVIDVSNGRVSLEIDVYQNGIRRAFDRGWKLPAQGKEDFNKGDDLYVRILDSDKDNPQLFLLEYSLQEYKGGRATTKKIEARRDRKTAKGKHGGATKVVVQPAVRILRDGSPLSARTRTVMVGERVNLSFDHPTASGTPSAFRWRVDGVIVKEFQGSLKKGNPVPFETREMAEKTVSYAWASVRPERAKLVQVRCSAMIGGVEYVATETFEVKIPRLTVRFAHKSKDLPNNIMVGANTDFPDTKDNRYMALGGLDGITPGFMFWADVQSPTSDKRSGDRWHYVQLVRTWCGYQDKKGRWTHWGTGSEWACDGQKKSKHYPYSPDFGKDDPPAFRLGKERFDDQPSLRLAAEDQASDWSFRGQTFVMYKPAGKDSVYVPLHVVAWRVSADIKRKDDGEWPRYPSNVRAEYRSLKTTRFPFWEHHVTEKEFWRSGEDGSL